MCGCTIGAGNFEVFLPQNGENYGSGTFPTFGIEVVCAYLLIISVTKNPHCVGVRTVLMKLNKSAFKKDIFLFLMTDLKIEICC